MISLNKITHCLSTIRSHLLLLLAVGMVAAGCRATPTPPPRAAATATPGERPAEVVLSMGSWRTDDVEQMNRI